MQVVDDPALSAAIGLLQGEWRVRGGGELNVTQVSRGALLTDQSADLIVFPPGMLGELCEGQRLRPMRDGALRDELLRFADIYPAVREKLLSYGGRIMALPIGCPAPVLACSVTPTDGELPQTWSDLLPAAPTTVSTFNEATSLSYLFLARAVSYAASETSESVLFDPQSMTPRLTEPPFLRALEALEPDQQGGDDGQSSQATVQDMPRGAGECLIAWPVRPQEPRPAAPPDSLRIALLPGASERHEPLSKQWTYLKHPQRITLLGASGRLLGVSSDSRNAAAAFDLAAWLAGPENARQLATASPNVANVRASLGVLPDDWSGSGDRRLGRQFAEAARQAYLGERTYVFPRILRGDEYLSALGAVVARVVDGSATAEAALQQAVNQWQELTDEIGREQQKRAYQRHLGLISYDADAR